MAERFYTPDWLAVGEYVLTGAEAHHLTTVRRFAHGDRVVLFNGDGDEYEAEIIGSSKKSVSLQVLTANVRDRELPFPLIVAAAVPKADRADYMIEKLTELGVSRYVPLITHRSIVVPRDSTIAKLSRAVIEASKQCGRNRLMSIDPPRKWVEFLALADLPRTRFVLHPAECATALNRGSVEGITIAVGPEGGFTPDEVAAAAASGWRTASLGPRVLRIETAAVAAAALAACNSIRTLSSPASSVARGLP